MEAAPMERCACGREKGERGVLFNVMECAECRQDAIKIKPELAHLTMKQWRDLCEGQYRAQYIDIKQQVAQ